MDEIMIEIDFMKIGWVVAVPLIIICIITYTFNCKISEFIFALLKAFFYGMLEFYMWRYVCKKGMTEIGVVTAFTCNGVQREHNKKLNNGLPILHKVPPKRDYGRYFCIMAEKGGTSHGGLTEKLSPFFHAKKQEVNAYGR